MKLIPYPATQSSKLGSSGLPFIVNEVGHGNPHAAIKKTGHLTDERIELSEECCAALDRKQQLLMDGLDDRSIPVSAAKELNCAAWSS